jgi:hypothetical protein
MTRKAPRPSDILAAIFAASAILSTILILAIIALALAGCASATDYRYPANTALGVGLLLGGSMRQPCPPPRRFINNVCTTQEEWDGR